MKVYRIQNKDGRGPFIPGFSHRWVKPRKDHDNLKCWMEEFGMVNKLLLVGEHGGSACLSKSVLRRWFIRDEYETLLSLGFQAVEMDVDRIIRYSSTQCFFGRALPLKQNVKEFDLYKIWVDKRTESD